MSGLKRFVSFIFALAGLLALAALLLPWVGPWQRLFTDLITTNTAWLLAVEICAGICAVGLLALLLRAIIARAPKNVVVTNVGGDEITVTREAIASQASHLIEMDGTCQADRVHVKTKRGSVFVRARVLPYESLDIVAKGVELHKRLTEGLVAVGVPASSAAGFEDTEPSIKPEEDSAAPSSEITLSKPSDTPITEFFEQETTTEVSE